jgi:hypothetical protein
MKFSRVTNLCIALAVAFVFADTPNVSARTHGDGDEILREFDRFGDILALYGPFCGPDTIPGSGCGTPPSGGFNPDTTQGTPGPVKSNCSDSGEHSDGSGSNNAPCHCWSSQTTKTAVSGNSGVTSVQQTCNCDSGGHVKKVTGADGKPKDDCGPRKCFGPDNKEVTCPPEVNKSPEKEPGEIKKK